MERNENRNAAAAEEVFSGSVAADAACGAQPALRGTRGGRAKKRKWTSHSFLALFLALLPMIGFVLFSTAPLIISIVALFCDVTIDWKGIAFDWNAFDGFRMIFDDDFGMGTQFARGFSSVFWKSLGITLWLGSTQFVTLLIALGLSVLLATKLKGSKLFQVLFFIPHICSSVSVAFMWSWMFLGQPEAASEA